MWVIQCDTALQIPKNRTNAKKGKLMYGKDMEMIYAPTLISLHNYWELVGACGCEKGLVFGLGGIVGSSTFSNSNTRIH